MIDALKSATALRRHTGAGGIDQNAPHDAGGDGEKVGAILPVHEPGVYEPDIGIVDQRRSVETPLCVVPADILPRHASQVIVNKRGQSVEGARVASAPRLQ